MALVANRQTGEDVLRSAAFVALVAEWDERGIAALLVDMSQPDLHMLAVELANRLIGERARTLAARYLVDEDEARRMVRDEHRRVALAVAVDLEEFDAEEREAQQ